MDGRETLEARFLGRDSVVLDVWYYCCAYVLYVGHAASVMLCTCGVVYIYYCVHMMLYANCMYGVVCILHIQFSV